MVKRVVQPHGGVLHILEKGETGNPNGRPRKLVNQLKHDGYKKDEVKRTISMVMAMYDDEIEILRKNKDKTQLEKYILRLVDEVMDTGKTDLLDYMMPKVSGQADEANGVNINIELPKDPVEASKAYQELMK